ncbi:MAG: HAMP domain-containing protein [Alphaproteobacteria bacterium]|nr:HAMP domain-containing protein [Alphaproteobacteria bacterium]NDC56280.1 HAMP domain-containing protein [Alphaproteobacteria bacterium]
MKRPRISALTWRILAVNALAPVLLVASFFYVGDYEERLIANEFALLQSEAKLVSMAVAESAAVLDYEENPSLSADLAANLVRRMVDDKQGRVRLFDADLTQLADSRTLVGKRGQDIQIEQLSALPPHTHGLKEILVNFFDWLQPYFRATREYPHYVENAADTGRQYPIVTEAAGGETAKQLWQMDDGKLLLGVAVPVQRYKKVLGAILLTKDGSPIDKGLSNVQADIIQIFVAVFCFTLLVSYYLSYTITEPLSRLAAAVRDIPASAGNAITLGRLSHRTIPDLSMRQDELGELSTALRSTTQALIQRLTAIEHFAADVAHELKNPLTSLRSAVETLQRVKDSGQQQKLLSIIRDDVDRLDRLITDTSTASRLEAELSRAAMQPVGLSQLLTTLCDLYSTPDLSLPPRLQLTTPIPAEWQVSGIASRLMQVLTNLTDNALSFSPPHKPVCISVQNDNKKIKIIVDDDGPGIPENKLVAIFDRFYSERPAGEEYGKHSGLGLSISKQIIEGHGGTIEASNRTAPDGKIEGARFVMTLPALS